MCVRIVPYRLNQHIGGCGIARINDLGRLVGGPLPFQIKRCDVSFWFTTSGWSTGRLCGLLAAHTSSVLTVAGRPKQYN